MTYLQYSYYEYISRKPMTQPGEDCTIFSLKLVYLRN